MKRSLFPVLLTLLFSLPITAQSWETDLGTARQRAADEDKTIVLVFQGSDWCAPCMKLNEEIWKSDEFQHYAADHFVMLLADFPKRKKNELSPEQQQKNNALAEQYNQAGYFPYVVVLDKEGTVLGTTGYNKMSPMEYAELLSSFKHAN